MPHACHDSVCSIASHATVTATLAEIAKLREAASPAGVPPLPPRFLRNADEQTVVGVRAVLEAMARYPEPRPSFEAFGVIASSCLAGRIASARTLVQMAVGGTVHVSPHIVPQCSLHAMASAVSVALLMHGPNIGVGGGPEALDEGLLTAMSFLDEPGVPGYWLIFSEWVEEPALDERGEAPLESTCRGVALAITPDAAGPLRLVMRSPSAEVPQASPLGTGSLASLAAALEGATEWSTTCHWGAEVSLQRQVAQPAVRPLAAGTGENA